MTINNQTFCIELNQKYGFDLVEYLKSNSIIVYVRFRLPKSKDNSSNTNSYYKKIAEELQNDYEYDSKYKDDEINTKDNRYLIETLIKNKNKINTTFDLFKVIFPFHKYKHDFKDKLFSTTNHLFEEEYGNIPIKTYDWQYSDNRVEFKIIINKVGEYDFANAKIYNAIFTALDIYKMNVEYSCLNFYRKSNLLRGSISLRSQSYKQSRMVNYDLEYAGAINKNSSEPKIIYYSPNDEYFPTYIFRNFRNEINFNSLYFLCSEECSFLREYDAPKLEKAIKILNDKSVYTEVDN